MKSKQIMFLARRCRRVAKDSKSKPECAQAARNFLALAERYALRHGLFAVADVARSFRKSIPQKGVVA